MKGIDKLRATLEPLGITVPGKPNTVYDGRDGLSKLEDEVARLRGALSTSDDRLARHRELGNPDDWKALAEHRFEQCVELSAEVERLRESNATRLATLEKQANQIYALNAKLERLRGTLEQIEIEEMSIVEARRLARSARTPPTCDCNKGEEVRK